jgi:hypothetical protein
MRVDPARGLMRQIGQGEAPLTAPADEVCG